LTAPFAAFGLRQQLTAYAGPLVKLRRASDSATQDFSPGADGWLDQTAVTTWSGGSNVFVDTLYDQSGNLRDATQATTGSQPQVVWGATGDNRPGMAFLGTTPNARLLTATLSKSSGPISAIVAGRRIDTTWPSVAGAMQLLTWGTSATGFNFRFTNTTTPADAQRGDLVAFGNSQTAPSAPRVISAAVGPGPGDCVFTTHLNASTVSLKTTGGGSGTLTNRAGSAVGAVPVLTNQILYIGNDSGTHPMNGWISEAVIWTSDMSASLGTLETRLASDYAKATSFGYSYHASSIDAASFPSMEVRTQFKPANGLAPVLVMMHSWSSAADYFLDASATRFSDAGYFVLIPGMRGRLAGAVGSNRDASGREIQDIKDALDWARAKYPNYADPNKAVIAGWSGGAGNALMATARFPDLWMATIDNFGMTDYGHDATYGWYNTNNATYGTQISTSVGDIPTNVPDKYLARKAIDALPTNLLGGFIWMFQDAADVDVSVEHSRQLKAKMDLASNTRYAYSETDVGANPRWSHQSPNGSNQIVLAEANWKTQALALSAWTIPTSGTVKVRGWIETKRFKITLSSNLEDESATVVYNTINGTYTVTPDSAEATMTVAITQGALTAGGSISTPTLFTVS
jgi:dienelactone hydrolase